MLGIVSVTVLHDVSHHVIFKWTQVRVSPKSLFIIIYNNRDSFRTPPGLHWDSIGTPPMKNPYPPGELHVDWRWTGDGLDVDLGSIAWLMFVEMSLLPVLWLSLSNPYPVPVESMWSPCGVLIVHGDSKRICGWVWDTPTWTDGSRMGDIIPLGQLQCTIELTPSFRKQANRQESSLEYSNKFWLAGYFDKETFFALHW